MVSRVLLHVSLLFDDSPEGKERNLWLELGKLVPSAAALEVGV